MSRNGRVQRYAGLPPRVHRRKAAPSPERRAVLDGLTKATQTRALLRSDLERMNASIQDFRHAFCNGCAIPKPTRLHVKNTGAR